MDNKIFRKIYYNLLPFGVQAYLTKIIFKPKFGDDMTISKGPKFYYGDVSFGNGVRIAGSSVFSNVTVGNYTVFAQNFRMLEFVHDYTAFSINSILPDILHKYLYNKNVKLHGPNIVQYPQTVIGSDVWIGEFVTVKGGVHIGDGAVVGAGSIVTHDVPPFAIVAGVPAKFIKWRFDEEKIKLLKDIKWWDWDKEKIAQNYEKLCRFDTTLRERELF